MQQNKTSSQFLEGRLDGVTMLRFAHASKSAGGVEQELELLNRILLERNKMTIIQMFSVKNNEKLDEKIERIGQGELIWVPMLEQELDLERHPKNWVKGLLSKLKNAYIFKYYIVYNPIISIFFKYFIREKDSVYFCRETVREKTRELFHRYNIDLVMLHSLSGSDSTEIINKAKEKSIPYAYQHHFNNIILKRPIIKAKVLSASAVGGVSHIGVPRYLKQRFANLSSGIDTAFFKPDNAKPLHLDFEEPIAFLPSRIVPGKGHLDLIYAVKRLKREGIQIKVVFAGRNDSPQFEKELKKLINQFKATDEVLFVGQLALKELRDWYAVSKVTVLPSATEGLSRILLEAQAMQIPPVAYNVGGVSEAMKAGETGFIVRKGNVRGLAAKLKELLTDDHRRIQMGEKGRRFVERQFGLAALAKRHEEFYLDAILSKSDKNLLNP